MWTQVLSLKSHCYHFVATYIVLFDKYFSIDICSNLRHIVCRPGGYYRESMFPVLVAISCDFWSLTGSSHLGGLRMMMTTVILSEDVTEPFRLAKQHWKWALMSPEACLGGPPNLNCLSVNAFTENMFICNKNMKLCWLWTVFAPLMEPRKNNQ